MAKQTYTTGQVLTAAQMTTLQANDFNQTVSAKVASYTLVAADVGTRITMDNASATTVTVNTAIFTAGDTLEITNIGVGICTVTAGTATVSTSSTLALKQFDSGQLYFTSTGVAIFFASDAADGSSPLTTKGDLYTFSTVDARLGVGANNTVLVADSAEATGLKWAAAASGGINPNLVINGNFTINQRAYVSAANLASGDYGFDRFKSNFTNTTLTFTAAPAGQSVTINSGGGLQQIVEQANVPAGTYTLSFTGTATGRIYNSGAAIVPAYAASPISFTADGAANVVVEFTATGATKTLSKIKLEAGSTATTYSYSGNTVAGELVACQRYYWRQGEGGAYAVTPGYGHATNTNSVAFSVFLPVTMRVSPTLIEFSGMALQDNTDAVIGSLTTITLSAATSGTLSAGVEIAKSGAFTAGRTFRLLKNNNTAHYIAASAEL